MKKIVLAHALLVSSIFLGVGEVAAEILPSSGSFSLNAIFKGHEPIKFNDDYSHYTATGVTFNEAGNGLFHMGKVACAYGNFTRGKLDKGVGFCTFEDKDGDSLFVQYSGAGTGKGGMNGVHEIIGGTGKFEGVRGSGSYACTHIDKKSEFPCTEKFDYQLKK